MFYGVSIGCMKSGYGVLGSSCKIISKCLNRHCYGVARYLYLLFETGHVFDVTT